MPDANYSEAGASYTDTDSALGIVSSYDGKAFYAPKDLRDNNASYVAGDMAEVTTQAAWEAMHGEVYYGNTHVGYMKYSIKVTAAHETGNGRKLQITLKAPTFTDTEHNDLRASYRIAFGDITTDADADLTIYRYEAANHTGYTSTGPSTVAAANLVRLNENVVIDANTHKTKEAGGIAAEFLLSIWVEGLDEHATNDLFDKKMSFGIDFDLVTYVP